MEVKCKWIKQCINTYGNMTLEQLYDICENANYVNIYTDGATQYKNGKRQSGIGVYFGDNDIRNLSNLVDTIDNNECELLACIEALSIAHEPFIRIYTDSRLVADGMNGKCKKIKFDLFNRLEQLTLNFIDVQFIFVKGHNNNNGNEKADALSRLKFN